MLQNTKVGNTLGLVSIAFCGLIPVFIFRPDVFPQHLLAEEFVFYAGIGGSIVAALCAGLIGSRWWFLGLLGTILDFLLMIFFSP